MHRKYCLLTILFCCIFSLSGCTFYSVDLVKNDDGTNTVTAYIFGCKDYLPDIYVDQQDFTVWQYCPNEFGKKGKLWKVGPTKEEADALIENLPDTLKQNKVNMQKCGDTIYKKNLAVLYCGEFSDADYKFKLWKDTHGIWNGLRSQDNYLEYTAFPLSPEMMRAKAKDIAEQKRLKEIRLREEEELAQKKQREEEELALKKQREQEEIEKNRKESIEAQSGNNEREEDDSESITNSLASIENSLIEAFDSLAEQQNIGSGDKRKFTGFKSDFRKCAKIYGEWKFSKFDSCFQQLINASDNFSNYKFGSSVKLVMAHAGTQVYYPGIMKMTMDRGNLREYKYYEKRFLDITAMEMATAQSLGGKF